MKGQHIERGETMNSNYYLMGVRVESSVLAYTKDLIKGLACTPGCERVRACVWGERGRACACTRACVHACVEQFSS